MAAELNGCAAQWSRSTAQGGPTLIFQSKTSRWPFRVTWSEQIAHQVDSSTWILFQARSRVTSLFTNLHTVDELTNELESLTSSSVCQLSGKRLFDVKLATLSSDEDAVVSSGTLIPKSWDSCYPICEASTGSQVWNTLFTRFALVWRTLRGHSSGKRLTFHSWLNLINLRRCLADKITF